MQTIRNGASISERLEKGHGESARLAPIVHSFYAVAMMNFILSAVTFAGFALIWGAWRLWRRDGLGQKVWLMLAAALAILANVAIWTVPDQQGNSLVKSGPH